MRLVSKIAFTIVLSTMLFCLVGQTMAQTQVSGEVSGLWSINDSPYEVTGDIYIPEDQSLTIEPGVVVSFQGPYAFRIFGTISAIGNLQDDGFSVNWITFTQDTSGITDETELWRGLRFDNSQSGSELEYCVVEFAYAHTVTDDPESYKDGNGGGIFVFGCSPRIENSIIRDCKSQMHGGGLYLWSTSSLIRNLLIDSNQANMYGGGIFIDKSSIELYNLTLVYNQAGLEYMVAGERYGGGVFYGPDTEPYIRNSIVWNNGIQDDDNEVDVIDDYLSTEGGFSNSFIKFSITSQNSSDVDNFIYNEDPEFVDEVEYLLQETSRGVDCGEYSDERYVNEPTPNGGRINIGVWGGTKRATRSVPVGEPAEYTVNFFNVRPSDSAMVRIVSVLNIGHNELTFNYDDVYLTNISMDPENEELLEEDIDLFNIVPFQDFSIVPDSTAEFNVTYMLDSSNYADDYVYLRVPNNSGTDVEFLLRGVPFNPLMNIPVADVKFDTLYMNDYPAQVNYDSANTFVQRTFEVRNVGKTNLVLRDTPWMPTNTDNVEIPTIGNARTILPDSSTTISVNYPHDNNIIRSYDYGLIRDTIEVASNDVIMNVAVELFVYGAVIERAEEDSLIDFEYVNVNSPRTLYINLKNRGNIDIPIDSLVFVNNDGTNTVNPDLSITVEGDGIIAAEDSLDVGIVLDPSGLNLYDVICTVYTDGACGDNVTFQIIGRGTSGGTYFSGEIPSTFIPDVWGQEVDGVVEDSIYICAGPTTIPVGQKLVIKKGVKVYFESTDWLQVEGEIQIMGTEDEPVIFAPLNNTDGNWCGGLRFVACDPSSSIEWAIIERASTTDDGVDQVQLEPSEHGGGIAVYNCSPSFYNVTVKNSFSHFDGGGMWIYQSSPSIVRCVFENNHATTNGGGISLRGGEPVFCANTVRGNMADLNGGGIYFQYYSDPIISNSIIAENAADGYGGGVFAFDHSSPVFLNDVVYGNTAAEGASAIRAQARSIPIIRNSVVWSHDGDKISNVEGGSLVIRYSIVEDIESFSNVDFNETVADIDPAFDGEFYPLDESPLVDGGDPSSLYKDYSFPPSKGTDTNDMGITGGQYAGYWDGNPLHLSIFSNSASFRYIDIIVNSLPGSAEDELSGTPEIEVTDWSGSNSYTPSTISDGVFYQSIEIEESSYLEISASGTTADNREVMIRKNMSVALYKPVDGGLLKDPIGSSLTLSPSIMANEMLITAEPDLGASTPDEVELSAPLGMRWNINSTSKEWNCEGEIILPYNEEEVSEYEARQLAIWQKNGDEWIQLQSYVNPSMKTVQAKVNSSGIFAIFRTGSEAETELLPTTTVLGTNYPNPFNPTTTIPFALSQSGKVEVYIYNVLGQEIANLTNRWYSAGHHQLIWDGRSSDGLEMSSGVYFYRLRTFNNGSNELVQTRKLVLMR